MLEKSRREKPALWFCAQGILVAVFAAGSRNARAIAHASFNALRDRKSCRTLPEVLFAEVFRGRALSYTEGVKDPYRS